MAVTANLTPAPNLMPIRRVLLSVSDKTGLVGLANKLNNYNVEFFSTGGTAQALKNAGFDVVDVSTLTGFPEIMDGRVKTLHPKVHGGLLAIRNDAAHARAMEDHDIVGIDLLVVNLYPFEETSHRDADFATIVENIDIGGPAMIRAGAKNHGYCAVVTDCQDYDELLAALEENDGQLSYAFRQQLAMRAFARIAAYDIAIAQWFAAQSNEEMAPWHFIAAKRQVSLRYGENPHQKAALYRDSAPLRIGMVTAQMLQGKPLSYNNIADGDAALELVSEFNAKNQAAVAIIKHANPCGVGIGANLHQAYLKAHACDPTSAFGGIVALNRPLDAETAAEITKIFTEVIIAPQASEAAQTLIAAKPNLRLLITGEMADPAMSGLVLRSVSGGFLVQSRDNITLEDIEWRVVTKRAPTQAELADLQFAHIVAKHVKSNAIVYARDGATVGIGAGQMSRLMSARIAASEATKGCVVASDAFFPFADGLLVAIEAGATAAIQPGGSLRDDEVIEAANTHNIAMIFTGSRHFRH